MQQVHIPATNGKGTGTSRRSDSKSQSEGHVNYLPWKRLLPPEPKPHLVIRWTIMDTKTIEGYGLEETLGTGHFAVVKLGRHLLTGARVAVKMIDKAKLDKVAREHLLREVRCMKRVEHPNIIRLYQVLNTESKLFLVLELGENGDLYDYISKHKDGLDEDESRDLFRQIVQAIWYCHTLRVVHRDLKPENVVFCQNATRVKLTDFGLSNLFDPGEKLKTSCGSLCYAAPEILLGDMYDAPAVDIWSLGVILYMLLVGEKPFIGGTDSETLTMIMDCKFEMPPHLSDDSVDLVKQLLVSDPKKRISLGDVLKHPWMTKAGAPTNEYLPIPPKPLQSQLGDKDHQLVIQKMLQENVATKFEIESSLELNAYDHISATYYLMATAHLEEKMQKVDSSKPISQGELERLDRRRMHVRKLSAPGTMSAGSLSPSADSRPSLKQALPLPSSPTSPTLTSRPASSPMSISLSPLRGELLAPTIGTYGSPRRKFTPSLAPIGPVEDASPSQRAFQFPASRARVSLPEPRMPVTEVFQGGIQPSPSAPSLAGFAEGTQQKFIQPTLHARQTCCFIGSHTTPRVAKISPPMRIQHRPSPK